VRGSWRVAWLVQAGLLLSAGPVAAQVKIGDFSNNLNGTVSTGYTADYGNLTSSDHNWAIGGLANLSGSFYSPNFLSYNASIYLNQSRANSDFQSISSASGVNASATIFGGSPYPGSISFSKAYNSEGDYAIPGLANYVTHGNSTAFGINWSENVADLPSLSAAFQVGNSSYSVYGADDGGANAFHSLNLHSAYSLAGFHMGAYYSLGGSHALVPEVVDGVQDTESHSTNDGYGFNVTHRLPMSGNLSAGINRSTWNTNYLDLDSNGTIDIYSAVASVHPLTQVSVTGSATYSDNLSGQLYQSVLAGGGEVPGGDLNQPSDSLDLVGTVGYAPSANILTTAYIERRTQLFLGDDYGETTFGGSAVYSHELLGGNFNASVDAAGNQADKTGSDSLTFSTSENFSRLIAGWNVTGSFGYAQNVETLLVTYLNSNYHYQGTLRRRWGKFNVSGGGGASRTGLTSEPGTVSSNQSYSASAGYTPFLTATGSYSKASGQALATGAGLVPVQLPNLPPGLITLYGGDSYSFALSSNPIRGLLLTVDYAKSNSNTSNSGVTSMNLNDEFNALIQYQVRKLTFNSGCSRLAQGFSGSGSPPEVISSFYIGVSRWFNFF